MPTVILKLLALTGVISAGCFAVWKANTELQPVNAGDPMHFSAVEGEPEESVGMGGEPIPKPAKSKAGKTKLHELDEDQSLALADQSFENDDAPEEEPRPHTKPAAFPSEPSVLDASKPEVVDTANLTDPEPGIASQEALDAAENAKLAGRARTMGSATPRSPLRAPGALSKFPTDAGIPALMTVPHSASTAKTTAQAPARTRGKTSIIRANAEAEAVSSEEIVPVDSEVPAAPGGISEPEIDQSSGEFGTGLSAAPLRSSLPAGVTPPEQGRTSLPAQPGRTRGIPNESNIDESAPIEEPNPFDRSAPGLEAVEEPAPVEAAPTSIPSGNRNRSSLPTPIDPQDPTLDEPGQLPLTPNRNPARTPTHTHAIEETTEPTPLTKQSIPAGAMPSRVITPDMLDGDGIIEDASMAPTQQPQLRIEKQAQAEAEVGVEFIYKIIVTNVGQVPAQHVIVEERIPKGCRMNKSNPVARLGNDRVLRWDLGTMTPNSQKVIQVQVTPTEAGSVGSVATVRFAAQVATKTMVTAPALKLTVLSPKEVAVGEDVPLKILIENIGQGIARNSNLRVQLQEGLEHPNGLDIDQKEDPWTLGPGQKREFNLVVKANERGRYTPLVTITANGIEQDNRTIDLNVIESRLSLTRTGHDKRFVNRPAEFVTSVVNNSAETMRNVLVTEHLPEGVTLVGDKGNAKWNSDTRTVTWTIPELGAMQKRDLRLTVKPSRDGLLAGKITAQDQAGHGAELATQLEVKGFSSLSLDIHGDGNAVAIGDQVTMRVTVENKGSASATNVQAKFELPREMTFQTAQGPGTFKREGNFVTFAAVEELEPNTKKTYDIVLIAAEEGTPNVRVDLTSAERPEPVRQDEAVTITPN